MRSGSPLARRPANVIPESFDRPTDLVEVGLVVDAYGVRGELRIEPFNAPQQSVLLKARVWWMRMPTQWAEPGKDIRVKVLRCRPHSSVLIAAIEEVSDRDAALAFKGALARVRRSDFPPAAAGEFYWVDLIGCRAVNPRGEDLGSVQAIDDHGAHPILVLRDDAGHERLVPYVPLYVQSVDLNARRIVLDWELDY